MALKKYPGIVCLQCNKDFIGTIKQKYCSQICSKKARESKKEVKCLTCNDTFLVQKYRNAKYCSKKCKYEHDTSDIIKVNCKNCNKEFSRKEHRIRGGFCGKDCSNKFNSGENHYEWKPLNHLIKLKDSLKRWGILVKQRDGYTCQLCGEKDAKVLESHHIKEKENYPELQLDINNGVTLCLKCHYLQHINHKKASRLIKYKIDKYYGKENK